MAVVTVGFVDRSDCGTRDDLRWRGRGTDTERKIEARLFRAREEYREAVNYDYIIINGDADVAANEFGSILTAERCRSAERKKYLAEAF